VRSAAPATSRNARAEEALAPYSGLDAPKKFLPGSGDFNCDLVATVAATSRHVSRSVPHKP
jgi:hypothetical protein